MTADQKRAYEFTVKGRGQVPGPYKICLQNPKLIEVMVPLGAYYQGQSSLSKAEVAAPPAAGRAGDAEAGAEASRGAQGSAQERRCQPWASRSPARPGKTQSVLRQDSGPSGRNDRAAQRAGRQLRECRRRLDGKVVDVPAGVGHNVCHAAA
jgi:hypothetical protein